MVKELSRKASDNQYLHKDFHNLLNIALDYLAQRFGQDAVEDYLKEYARNYFTPQNLVQIKDYILGIYKAESAEEAIEIIETKGRLLITVKRCPAVEYIGMPSEYFKMTTEIVYGELAKMSGFIFAMHYYDEMTGAASYTFEEIEK